MVEPPSQPSQPVRPANQRDKSGKAGGSDGIKGELFTRKLLATLDGVVGVADGALELDRVAHQPTADADGGRLIVAQADRHSI